MNRASRPGASRWAARRVGPGTALALALDLLGACGGPPATPPPVPAAAAPDGCPLPLLFSPDQDHPRYVRIENPGREPRTVFIDRCFWHTRLAEVPPGQVRQVPLPGELVTYHGSLFFHAYDRERRVASYRLDVGTGPILRLVLEPEEEAPPDSLPRWKLPEGTGRSAGPTVLADPDGAWVSVWGVGGGGVLTWACAGEEGPWLSVTLGREARGEAPPAVEVEFDDRSWEDAGSWQVMRSVTDAVVAPLETGAHLTEEARSAEHVRVRIREGRWGSTTFAFRIGAVRDHLPSLSCGSPPPSD